MSTQLTPEQRSLRARVAAHHQWARTTDRTARTAAARDRFDARFARQVDEATPQGFASPEDRQAAIAAARSAYFAALALKSSRSRSAKR